MDVFGGLFGDFEHGQQPRQQQNQQQDRRPQEQHDGQGVLRAKCQGQLQRQLAHMASSDDDRAAQIEPPPPPPATTAATAAAAVAVSNRTQRATATTAERDAGVSPHAAPAPASCSSSSRSTSSTVATKAPSSTSSSEASPAPAPASAPAPPPAVAAAAAGIVSEGEESNGGRVTKPAAEPRGQGARAEPAAGRSAGAAGAAEAAGWDDRETLVSLYESVASSGAAGERGTPVPPDLRPPGRELDVLCEWGLEQLRVDDEVGMFSRGTFGTLYACVCGVVFVLFLVFCRTN